MKGTITTEEVTCWYAVGLVAAGKYVPVDLQTVPIVPTRPKGKDWVMRPWL